MKHLAIFFFAIATTNLETKAQWKLDIEITELHSDKGPVMLELFDANHKVLTARTSTIHNKKTTITIEDLKPGKYAVRYFHDENVNGKLDSNLLGIPTEGYGFSNDAYSNFGPKPFEEWLVDVSRDNKIVLKTKN